MMRITGLLLTISIFFSSLLFAEQELVFTFAGDLIPHGELHRIDIRAFEDLSQYLRTDDLTFANIETPLDPNRPPAGFPDFNAPPSFLRAAADGGVEALSLANNHALDNGVAGVAITLSAVAEIARGRRQFQWSGLDGWTDRPPPPTEIEIAGFRIGFLSVTQFLNHWPPESPERLLNLVDGRNRDHFLTMLRPEEYDFFILSYHGNAMEEYEPVPEERKMRFLRSLAQHGVDLVWGHHPHIPQPPLTLTDGKRESLILPSTGNFLTGQGARLDPEDPDPNSPHAPRNDGYIYRVTLGSTPGTPRLHITGLELIPFTTAPAAIPGGRKVTTFDRAIREAPTASWGTYYRRREKFLREQAAAWLRAVPWGASGATEPTGGGS